MRIKVTAALLLFVGLLIFPKTVQAEDGAVYVPYIKGDWNLLFKPEKTGDYINDHTVYRHTDGSWHVIGITRIGRADPSREFYFAHGSGKSLIVDGGFKEHEKVCDYGHKAYAPHAISHEDVCHLFWGPDLYRLDTSRDMFNWKYQGVVMDPTEQDPKGTFRDTMTLKVGDKWVMYSTGIIREGKLAGYGTVDVWESADLKNWSFKGRALTTSGKAPCNTHWGCCESPFVVKYGDWYYLFTTYTDCSSWSYQNTLVFKSKDPYNFGDYDGSEDRIVTRLATHAPEVINNPDDGKWYITSCGWKGSVVACPGGVAIAELGWHKEGQPPAELDGKLLAHWDFNQVKGEKAFDVSGSNRHAVIHGASLTPDGKKGDALRFDGSDDWLDIPDFHLNRDFTVCAWFKPEKGGQSQGSLIGQEGPGQDINFYGGKPRLYAPGDVLVAGTTLQQDKWYHITFVRSDDKDLKYYIDGELDGTGRWVGLFKPKAIGRGNADTFLKGVLDEVKLYSKALSAKEIKKIYEN